jgi:hypothetical protein
LSRKREFGWDLEVSVKLQIARSVRAHLIAATLVASLTTPALAGMFYVVQDTATKACRIAQIPPDGKIGRRVGVTAYMTKAEAKTAKKMAAECKAVH